MPWFLREMFVLAGEPLGRGNRGPTSYGPTEFAAAEVRLAANPKRP